jgi:type IV pilus assembly protein PilO
VDKVIEKIAKAPVGLKIAAVFAAVAVVTVVNLFVVSPFGPSVTAIEARISRAEEATKKLQNDIAYKTGIANDLNRFRKERELLEQKLNEALAELPEQKKIEDILELFEDRAQKAGLVLVGIEPKEQKIDGFYARIPINMKVTGNFHEIATFFDSLGRLRRIVNVSDIKLGGAKEISGKVVLAGDFTATTFMFVDPKVAAEAAAKNKKGGKK